MKNLLLAILATLVAHCSAIAAADLNKFVPAQAKDKTIEHPDADRVIRLTYWAILSPPALAVEKSAVDALTLDGWTKCVNRSDPWLSYEERSPDGSLSRVSNFIEVWHKANSVLMLTASTRKTKIDSSSQTKQEVQLTLYTKLTPQETNQLLEPLGSRC